MEQLQTQINELKRRLDELTKSNSIPRNVETAFRQRLGSGGLVGLAGRGTMSGGILDVLDGRITTSSIATAIVYNSSAIGVYQLAGGANAGRYRFFEGSFSQTWQVDYIIIFQP